MWTGVMIMVIGRTWFGCFGHYYVHAKKPCLGEFFFDFNYVGSCMTAFDGHVMLHHAYTHTRADIKTSLFGGMWKLPMLLRFPAFTIHKFGQVFGTIVRAINILFIQQQIDFFAIDIWITRIFLIVEIILFASQGKTSDYVVQFVFSLWLNTFLVLSSHDFEDFMGHEAVPNKDWGVFQVENSHDLTIIGNKWLDVLFTAGLSPHRAHHLLPYQTSGFANVVSESVIKELLPEFGLEWIPAKNFWTERCPAVFRFCFLYPTNGVKAGTSFLEEHLDPSMYVQFVKYCAAGFVGIGAI